MTWTAELRSTAIDLWKRGYSATEVGQQVGKTRGAVIGIAMRAGLQRGERSERTGEATPRRRGDAGGGAQRAIAARKARQATPKPAPKPKPVVAPTDGPVPASRMLTLMQLGDRHCRWPIGDVGAEDFRFCAADKADRAPYCAAHDSAARNHGGTNELSRHRLRRLPNRYVY